MKKKIEYNIGIDIGKATLGWAVTDLQYRLLKFKKHNMWGACLFEEADTAAKCRMHRSSRRRYNKRRERLAWLDTFFLEEVQRVDPIFKKRMKKLSFLNTEDKSKFLNAKTKDNLFVGEYDDAAYFKQFPTVYHLRNHLCTCEEKADSRFVYLALHHIIKYRGNFLYEGQDFETEQISIYDTLKELFEELNEQLDLEIYCTEEEMKSIITILQSNNKKYDLLCALPFVNKNKQLSQVFKAIVGNTCDLEKLFKEKVNNKKLKFSSSTYETDIENIEAELQDKFNIILLLHKIYSWAVLQDILKNESSISKAMIHKYKQHEEDLKNLKYVIKTYANEKYDSFFKSKNCKAQNYYNYIKHPRISSSVTLTQEMICGEIEKILSSISNCEDPKYKECLEKAKQKKLLPKQNSKDNSAIPFQLHLKELKEILNQQMKYYPSLKENYNKICMLVSFRYPYYIGPLSKTGRFTWLDRKDEKERIAPWNFDQVIDVDKTAFTFIERMLNTCTYFPNEKVLPANSLYVTKYELLNELNRFTVDDKRLSLYFKNKIIDELFMKKKVVKEEDLRKYCKKQQCFLNSDNVVFKGYQKDKQFASTLEPWITFAEIFGEITSANMPMIEDIILWLTIYEDKKICRKKIIDTYALSDDIVSQIMKLRYTGWSKLSKKLLVDIKSNGKSILDILEITNENLQQIITNNKYTFKKQIEKAVEPTNVNKIIYDDIAALHGSPALKRGIWTAVQVIQEIIKVMKCEPKNIYVEFLREEGEKKRTEPRVKKLQIIYDAIKKDSEMDFESVDNQLRKENANSRLEDTKLFLYYLQQGKCMYTGEPLEIENLSNYEIDHIIPQYIIPDDSIDNKVLVKKKRNQEKGTMLAISADIRDKQSKWWDKLKKYHLISDKKYYHLTKTYFKKEDIAGFINRQLVETRQINKHVVSLLSAVYSNVNVVAIRANLITGFRKKHNLLKIREYNDCHHAHDAYIASVMGRYIQSKFPGFQNDFIYNKYSLQPFDVKSKNGFILGGMNDKLINEDTGEVLWNPDRDIAMIKKCFAYKDYYITKKLDPQTGSFYDMTIYPNEKNRDIRGVREIAHVGMNANRNDSSKYGGYKGEQSAYYYPISYVSKNKVCGKIIGIPIMMKNASKKEIEEYISQKLKTDNFKILGRPIYKFQLIKMEGNLLYIVSDNEVVNAKQLFLSNLSQETIHKVIRAIKHKNYKDCTSEELLAVYDELCMKLELQYPIYDTLTKGLVEKRLEFVELNIDAKALLIMEMLKVTKVGASRGNLGMIGLSKAAGRKGGFTFDLSKITFISQSVTGMYNEEFTYDLANNNDNETL